MSNQTDRYRLLPHTDDCARRGIQIRCSPAFPAVGRPEKVLSRAGIEPGAVYRVDREGRGGPKGQVEPRVAGVHALEEPCRRGGVDGPYPVCRQAGDFQARETAAYRRPVRPMVGRPKDPGRRRSRVQRRQVHCGGPAERDALLMHGEGRHRARGKPSIGADPGLSSVVAAKHAPGHHFVAPASLPGDLSCRDIEHDRCACCGLIGLRNDDLQDLGPLRSDARPIARLSIDRAGEGSRTGQGYRLSLRIIRDRVHSGLRQAPGSARSGVILPNQRGRHEHRGESSACEDQVMAKGPLTVHGEVRTQFSSVSSSCFQGKTCRRRADRIRGTQATTMGSSARDQATASAARRVLGASFLLVAEFLVSGPAAGGDLRWTALGPWTTGGANALALDPRTPRLLYAASGPSIFRSSDAGQTWSWRGSDSTALGIRPIVIDPNAPATIFAGAGEKIVRSKDGGETWDAVYTGDSTTAVTGLALDPTQPPTIYASIEDNLGPHPGGFVATGDVLKSRDGGETWVNLTEGRFFPAATVLLIDPRARSVLYVGAFGTGSRGVYRSDNGGLTFKALSISPLSCCAAALAADPAVPRRIYAGFQPAGDGALFRSDDRGETWVQVDAGLFGVSGDHAVVALVVLRSSSVLAATPEGLFRSGDAGATWTKSDDGIEGTVQALTAAPSGPRVYALTDRGVFVTEDSAQTWSRLPSPFAPIAVAALTRLPGTLPTLFAGTDQGAFLSSDDRTTWVEASDGLPAGGVQAVAVAPSRDCPDPCAPLLLAGTKQGLYRSDDRGAHWSRFENALFGSVLSVATNPSDERDIFIGTALGKVARTSNAGSRWSEATLGTSGQAVVAVALDPESPTILFASNLGTIFKSRDGGSTWKALSPRFLARSLAIGHGSVFAGTNEGVYVSRDGGTTWGLASDGMASFVGGLPGVPSLAVDPGPGLGIYAGTFFDGVFSSTDSGENWSPIVEGLPFERNAGFPQVFAMVAENGLPTTLSAGTSLGVYAMTLVLSTDRNVRPLPRRRPISPRPTIDR